MRKALTSIAFLALSPLARAAYAEQASLGHPSSSGGSSSSDNYHFKYPIKKVAIIGAGVGGLIAYRELTQAGVDVHIYERDNQPGGNWHYTDEVNVDAPIPASDVAVGDYTPSLPPENAALPYVEVYDNEQDNVYQKRAHRAPRPMWKSLTTNAPAPIQQIRELPWPSGTAWALPNQKVQRYLRAFASWHGLNVNDNNPNVSYNTRVELVEKRLDEDGQEHGWTVTVKNLVDIGAGKLKATWTKEDFDAVVVATGRYNAPHIPAIEGLKEWNDRFPGHIEHSRQYRVPEPVRNQTVLIIGGGQSASQISRDIIQHVKKAYQSIRPQNTPVPQVPQDVTIVPEIKRFLPLTGAAFNGGRIELVNGSIITGVDRIILATGYRYSYPFLPQYHNSSLGINDTVPLGGGIQPIVTDGTHLRSLYLDIFYIPDPTLSFINANLGIESFTYGEFLSLAVAKVWAGKADLPLTAELWRRYYKLYEERKGYGKQFSLLGTVKMNERIRFFRGWLNDAAAKYGGRQIDGLSPDLPQIAALWSQARSTGGNLPIIPNHTPSFNQVDYVSESVLEGTDPWIQDLVMSDCW